MRFKAFLCNWRIGSVTVPLPPPGLKISFACTAPWLGTAVAVVALVLLCCCWLKGYLNPTPFCSIVLCSVLAPQVLVKMCLMGDCSWGKFLSDFLTSQKLSLAVYSSPMPCTPSLYLQIAQTCLCLRKLFRILLLVFGLIFQAVIGIFCKHKCLMLNRVMTENNKMKSPFPPGQEIFVQSSTVNS